MKRKLLDIEKYMIIVIQIPEINNVGGNYEKMEMYGLWLYT